MKYLFSAEGKFPISRYIAYEVPVQEDEFEFVKEFI